jgi:hypothetical protein
MARAWKPDDPLPEPEEPLPLWTARDKREKNAFRDWTFDRIEEAFRAGREAASLSELKATDFADLIEQDALADARRGDVTKLRQLAKPAWRPFINPQPLKRGEKYPRRLISSSDYSDRVHTARLIVVPLIREIWRTHYDKSRRRPEDGYSADEIAAAFLNVKVEDVERKASGKRAKKSRDK